MKSSLYVRLRRHLRNLEIEDALQVLDALIPANPLAAQLHLYRSKLLQLSEDARTVYPNPLREAESALFLAAYLDPANLGTLIDLMHFYDAVLPHRSKAIRYARRVRTAAQRALAEAEEVLSQE